MSAFTRELPDAGYYRGLKVPAEVLRNIDEKTKKAVSGTGGAWAPSSPIILAGEGLELQCGLQLTGATANPGVGKHFIFGDDDYFQFATQISRVIDVSPMLGGKNNYARGHLAIANVNDLNLSQSPSMRSRLPGGITRFPLRIPDGCRLASVEITFRVSTSHSNAPEFMPRARIIRIAADGVVSEYPHQTTAAKEPGGWVSVARPASGALWYAAAANQTLTLTFDATESSSIERVDREAYDYALEWQEESGTDAFTFQQGNELAHFFCSIRIPDLRPY